MKQTNRDILKAFRGKTSVEAMTLFERLGYSFEERDDVDAFYEQLSAAVRSGRVELVKRKSDATYIKAIQ